MDPKCEAIADQQWRRDEDGHLRSGPDLAELLEAKGCYRDAAAALACTIVGDTISTGVTVYERIK